jgi:hypothetical protein
MAVSMREKNHQVSINKGGWVATSDQGKEKKERGLTASLSFIGVVRRNELAGQPRKNVAL